MDKHIWTRTATAAGLLALLPFLAGCGVIFGGTRQTIRATSSPDAATIQLTPPTVEYRTPASLSIERKQESVLTFSMPGYTSQKVQLQRSMRVGILVLDVLTGCVGVIVDAVTGAWYELSPEIVSVTLLKMDAALAGPETITLTVDVKPTRAGATVGVDSTVPGVRLDVR